MTWHVPPPAVERYVHGGLTHVQTASVEAHIEACARCQRTVAEVVTDGPAASDLDRVWFDIVDELDRPPATIGQRIAVRAGAPEHIVRLLASAPGLRWPWLAVVAMCALGALAIAAASKDPSTGRLPFLIVAPLLPLGGVALGYGPSFDPAHELALASPYGSGRLALVRAVSAAAATIPMVAVVGVLLPEVGWQAAAWLAPALALSSLTLALSRRVALRSAALVVGGAWVALVIGAAGWRPGVRWSALAQPDLAFAAHYQPMYLALTACCVLIVVDGVRRDVPLPRRIR